MRRFRPRKTICEANFCVKSPPTVKVSSPQTRTLRDSASPSSSCHLSSWLLLDVVRSLSTSFFFALGGEAKYLSSTAATLEATEKNRADKGRTVAILESPPLCRLTGPPIKVDQRRRRAALEDDIVARLTMMSLASR